jgi:hypothetical protein
MKVHRTTTTFRSGSEGRSSHREAHLPPPWSDGRSGTFRHDSDDKASNSQLTHPKATRTPVGRCCPGSIRMAAFPIGPIPGGRRRRAAGAPLAWTAGRPRSARHLPTRDSGQRRSRLTSDAVLGQVFCGSSVLWRGRRRQTVLVLFGKVAVATSARKHGRGPVSGPGVPRARCPKEPSMLLAIPSSTDHEGRGPWAHLRLDRLAPRAPGRPPRRHRFRRWRSGVRAHATAAAGRRGCGGPGRGCCGRARRAGGGCDPAHNLAAPPRRIGRPHRDPPLPGQGSR